MGSAFWFRYSTHIKQKQKQKQKRLPYPVNYAIGAIRYLAAVGLSICLAVAIRTIPLRGNPLYNNINETLGIVTAITDGCLVVQGEPLTENAFSEVIVTIDGTTVYDLMTGLAIQPDDITEGTQVRVAYGPPLSDAEPPVVAADIVWLNYGVEGAAVFQTAVSGNIRYGDGYCAFISDDGYYRVTLAPDTWITDMDGACLTPEDIQPGMTLFLWADLVTASLPAQAYPERAVLIYSAGDCDAEYGVDYDTEYDTDYDTDYGVDYDTDYDADYGTNDW